LNYKPFILPALVIAAALGATGVAMAPMQYAAAQAANPAPPPPPGQPPQPRREFVSHIDGRIAFLKAELKITPAQEPQWEKVAQALRQNSEERRKSFEQARATDRTQPPTALQHLEAMARMSAIRAQQTDRVLVAFRPLYDSLSDEQKKAADELMSPHRHGPGHFRGPF
jgi:periplasmic protein CpxP/Spy